MGDSPSVPVVEEFIARWQGREGGQERANYVSFLTELIALLGLPKPDPADATHKHNDYVFERAVKKTADDASCRKLALTATRRRSTSKLLLDQSTPI